MKYYSQPGTDEIYAYEADGSQDAFIKEGLIELNDEELAAIRARQEAAQAPTTEELLKAALDQRDTLLGAASLHIAPLQDAVDLDEATPAETASLKLWKQYRIAVNRVSSQPGFPITTGWPEQPSK